jgi:CMP-N,N'-diacetyllegionaminic acid synthase
MTDLKILFSIGARGGSKGFQNKNISDVHGKPLIAWSIEQALNSKYCSDVVVTTDCVEIAEVAKQNGAHTPFMRPDHLANDSAGKWDVWQHCLKSCEEIYGIEYDLYVDLDCTSPLRDTSDIDNVIEMFLSQAVDAVFTVCDARKNPYFNLVEPNSDGHLKISKTLDNAVVCRQAAPPVYEHVASIYALSTAYLRKGSGLLSGNTIGYDIGVEKSLDLDSAFDKRLIEFLMLDKDASL